LGISAHSYAEVSRTIAYKPSYIAIGPIYNTTSKDVAFASQGLNALSRWRRTLPYPMVAIGGITMQRMPEVLATGVDGIAVISDILQAKEPVTKAKAWQETYTRLQASLVN
jgi:hydroxymethylpyrimidine kinase/phosphomethylpyrimidine kinase/thiamine-phosphate diphosphorylase